MAIQTTEVGDSATTIYTSSGNSAITFVSFCNYSTTDALVDVNIIPNGDLPSNANMYIKSLEIVSNDTYLVYQSGEKLLLSDGDIISVTANSSGKISALVSYTPL